MFQRQRLILLTVLTIYLSIGAVSASALQLKIATLAPDGSDWLEEARAGADEIAERTSGRVKVRFYPGGTMGNEVAVLRKIRVGQLHGSAMTAGTLATIYPDMQIYSLPLLFDSFQEVDHVRQQIDKKLIANLGEQGFISFGLIEGGFAYLMSGKEVRGIADLKSRKAWLPEGDDIGRAVFEAADISPVPLPLTDVLTGLQTGLIDTVAGPPIVAVALQWFTKVKYITDMPLIYTYGTLVVSEKALSRVNAEDRKVIDEVFRGVCANLDESGRTENDESMEALVRQGMKTIEAPAASLEEWRQLAARATEQLVSDGAFSNEMYAEIVAIRSKYRSQQATASE
jgi:TRAP-type C4-dicarboxylate transport system substrate-binding protein